MKDGFESSGAVADALEAIDAVVYRSGAPAGARHVALIVERHQLDAANAAELQLAARELGLVEEPDGVTRDPAGGPAGQALAEGFTSLDAFWSAAGRFRLLDAAEERDLARRVHQGEAAQLELDAAGELSPGQRRELVRQAEAGRAAKDRFVCANLRLVASIVRPLRDQGLDMSDLLQEGVVGLIRAVEKFDPTLGFKFSTYATWWVRQSAQRGLADKGRAIRLPVHVHERIRKVMKARRQLEWSLGREPTVTEIADRIGGDAADVAFVMDASRRIMSLDAPVSSDGEGTGSLIDFIEGREPSVEQLVTERFGDYDLNAAIGTLTPREAEIVRSRYGIGAEAPATLEQIGQTQGVTRERVRQVEKKALEKLRAQLEASS